MRFIAKVLKDSLHEKFPDASEDELLKVRDCLPQLVIGLPTRLSNNGPEKEGGVLFG